MTDLRSCFNQTKAPPSELPHDNGVDEVKVPSEKWPCTKPCGTSSGSIATSARMVKTKERTSPPQHYQA